MGKIQQLDEPTINKIAAGEVIERPSSVVKELIENSLDANASIINIEIRRSGKELIKVVDNGHGMPKDDAMIAFQRHTTSKITNSNDLFNITTLGFRGEALASIAAVSHTTMITKEKNALAGFQMDVIGGITKYSQERGCPEGTSIEVKDLFFNTPARRKFMKTEVNELRHIIDIVTRYALINKDVSFRLTHNGSTILSSEGNQNLLNNIASVYGNDIAKELLKIEYQDQNLKVKGYISKPSLVKNDKSYQSIFINGRYVKSDIINNALYDAYHSLLFVNKHPVAVLDVNIDPNSIDVNIHPTKSQIKFEQNSVIYNSMFNSVRNTLENHNLIFESDVRAEQESQMKFSGISEVEGMDFLIKPPKQNIDPSKQTVLSEQPQTEQKAAKVLEASRKFPRMKLLGQVHKTFFIAESEEGIMLIDQHVVQERILYERFMTQHIQRKINKQSLLNNEIVELSPEETIFLKQSIRELEELGFEVEHFGDNSFLVRSVPVIFKNVQTTDLLKEIITTAGKNRIKEIKEEIITRMACRASIKAGDTVSIMEMEKLLEELAECRLPYTCPHGRPIFIKLSVDELEKKFRRK